jgi:cytochrome P450
VSDPLALYCIAIKDASIWLQPAEVLATNSIIFGEGLTSTGGEIHRKQRKMMKPAFSTTHMRDLTPIFYAVTGKLRDAIAAVVESGPREVDMLSWTARAALKDKIRL